MGGPGVAGSDRRHRSTAALAACGDPVEVVERTDTTGRQQAAAAQPPTTELPATTAEPTTTERPTTTTIPTTTVPPTTTTTAPPEDPEVTNARRSAQSYLDLMGFSRQGLIEQLEYEGYPTEKATAAVDSLAVDWHAEAVDSAQSYVDTMPFSHSGLVDQLVYEGFTPEQATTAPTASSDRGTSSCALPCRPLLDDVGGTP